MRRTVLLTILTAFAAAAQSPDGDVNNGRALFVKIGCYQCHGYAGQGGVAGARLAGLSYKAPDLIRYVRRPPGEMPAYPAKVVSDQELTDIYAYIRTLPARKPVSEIPLLERIKERK
jgi:ubiquinol-cytochrome c reductase cytochrome c subunit